MPDYRGRVSEIPRLQEILFGSGVAEREIENRKTINGRETRRRKKMAIYVLDG